MFERAIFQGYFVNTKPTISLADYIDRLKKAKISVDSEDTGSFNETGCEMRTLYVSNQIRENGISIGYTMYFSHPEGKPHLLSDPEEGQEGAWFESSFAFDVLDEDGEDDDLLDEDVLFSLAAEHTKITDLVV